MSKPCADCDEVGRTGYLDHPHCDDCHRSWAGHAECHCVICHRQFGGESAFTAHQADGTCRDPASLKDGNGKPRFRPIERKDGFVWVRNVDFPADAFSDDEKAA